MPRAELKIEEIMEDIELNTLTPFWHRNLWVDDRFKEYINLIHLVKVQKH